MKELNYIVLYNVKLELGHSCEYAMDETLEELIEFIKIEMSIYGEDNIDIYKIFSLDKEYEFKDGEIKEL
jgi:hypothetical protein